MKSYGIIFPVYNEEKRIENGIISAYKYISSLGIDFQFLIVDNASTDRTQNLAEKLCQECKNVDYLKIQEKGVGVAFRYGVYKLNTDIVGYMDIDLSTDIKHFAEVVKLFNENAGIALVNGSRFHKKSKTLGRKWYRNITSYGLIFLLKVVFGMKASDAICGFKFFDREAVKKLIEEASDENGWFYIIELLLRGEKNKINIVELPVQWNDDTSNSKVDIIRTVSNYMVQIIKLKRTLSKEK